MVKKRSFEIKHCKECTILFCAVSMNRSWIVYIFRITPRNINNLNTFTYGKEDQNARNGSKILVLVAIMLNSQAKLNKNIYNF